MTHGDHDGGENERLYPHPEVFKPRESERNGYVRNFTAVAGLLIQTVVLIGSLLGFVRWIEKRIDAVDAHLVATAGDLGHHIQKDHKERDRSRLLLHNGCAQAMKQGCHTGALPAD